MFTDWGRPLINDKSEAGKRFDKLQFAIWSNYQKKWAKGKGLTMFFHNEISTWQTGR
jgi:hypothetical protein